MATAVSYTMGDFGFLKNEQERRMLVDAFKAMQAVDGSWTYLAQRDVPEQSQGFMFSRDPLITKIGNEVDKDGTIGHSGMSYAWTMRQIEYIAKNGWAEYIKLRTENTQTS